MTTRSLVTSNPWSALRRFTPARIALGRVGSSLPTDEVLRFGLAHARARAAVHRALDVEALRAAIEHEGWESLCVKSAAPDRATFLLRPDLGRRLDSQSGEALRVAHGGPCDILFVIADGLSAAAVQQHAVPLIAAARALLPDSNIGSVVVAEQGRVALGDAIGALMAARFVAMLIGERPGLSSPDSMGIYLTREPRIGRPDAERNCISNVRPDGLAPALAARKLAWLIAAADRIGATGVALKDQSAMRLPANDTRIGTTPAASRRR